MPKPFALLTLAALFAVACSSNDPTPADEDTSTDVDTGEEDSGACVPDCDNTHCAGDGCGGRCACPSETKCDGLNRCIPDPDTETATEEPDPCTDTCDSLAFECGEVCGVSCGACSGDNQTCEGGLCVCEPVCVGTHCGPDGCGGFCYCSPWDVCDAAGDCVAPASCGETCVGAGWECGDLCGTLCNTCGPMEHCNVGTCEEIVNCASCSLQLRLLGYVFDGLTYSEVTIGIDYAPDPIEPNPHIVDLYLRPYPPATLTEVTEGDALTNANKNLSTNSDGDPWFEQDNGDYQLVALSAGNTDTIGAGRIATLTFTVSSPAPLRFNLIRRAQTFTPPEADQALQASDYDFPITID